MLVADDDPSFARLVERYLERAGYAVRIATDGDQVLELMSDAEPHVVLADIGMPRLDGICLTRALRQRYPDVKVVLMTADPNVKSAAVAVELGAFRYLVKPFERAELLSTIGEATEAQHRAEEAHTAMDLLRSVKAEQQRISELTSVFDEVLRRVKMAYQPIIHAADGRLFGHEALLRSEDHRMSSPAAILDTAEQLDRLDALGRVVRAAAAQPFFSASAQGVLFVNLHARDLLDEELFSPEAPLSRIAARVVLEITERAPMCDMRDVLERTARLRAMAFRIAVDDLGAGYAAITTLSALEPEIVKLDMGLIRDVHRSRSRRQIVQHLVGMAHDAGARVVAEGVETEGERGALCELGCDFLQGYLIGRPGRSLPWMEDPNGGDSCR